MTRRIPTLLLLALAASASAQAPEPDLVPFPRLGHIACRPASQIASSPWSIGCETLDRDFAVYGHYKKYLGPLGAKGVRLQAGWAKTERQKGVYAWAWLDAVVDDAIAQGVRPWLETSYGNPLYEGGGGTGLGDGIPRAPEALEAWDRWVLALVRRYKDRVTEWEIWNEPDLGKEAPAEGYADLYIRTAEILRREQPAARLYALGLAGNLRFAEAFLACVREKGKLGLLDAITIHGYPKNPDDTSNIDALRAILDRIAPAVRIRQGETGAPSTASTSGALKGHPWTERTQAKWDLRRMLAHRAKDIPFNLFTLMELDYTVGRLRGMNTKGLLKANPDGTVAYAKPAYDAARNVMSVFDGDLLRAEDVPCTADAGQKLALTVYRHAKTKKVVVATWLCGAVPSDANEAVPVDFRFARGGLGEPVYADLRTGRVYRVPEEAVSRDGETLALRRIPVYDSPVLLADRAALTVEAR